MYHYFQVKKSCFGVVFVQKPLLTQPKLEQSAWTRLKYGFLTTFYKKGLTIPIID